MRCVGPLRRLGLSSSTRTAGGRGPSSEAALAGQEPHPIAPPRLPIWQNEPNHITSAVLSGYGTAPGWGLRRSDGVSASQRVLEGRTYRDRGDPLAKKNVPVVSRAEPSAGFRGTRASRRRRRGPLREAADAGDGCSRADRRDRGVLGTGRCRSLVGGDAASASQGEPAQILRDARLRGDPCAAPSFPITKALSSSTIARSRSDTSTSPSREREFGNLKGGGTRQLSAQNAKKHGLSLSVWHNAELAPDVEALSRRIAAGNEALLPLARDIAEAQIDLSRVRHLRGELIDRALRDPKFRTVEQSVQLLKLLARVVQIEAGRGRFSPSEELRAQRYLTKKPKGGPSVTPRFCRGSRRSLREWTDTNGVREIDVTLEKKAP